MSTLTIDSNAKPIQVLRPLSTSTRSLSGTAASATAISAASRVARIVATTDCFYNVTTTATVSNSVYLPAGTVEFVHVFAGDTISFITSGATGTAYISEMV
jgi:hypothetical protein